MQHNFDEDAAIGQINALFQCMDFVGEDRDVVITIRAKASQIALEEVSKPIYETVDSLEYQPLYAVQQYYRLSLRNPTPPAGHSTIEIKYPKQHSYYFLDEEPNFTYYKHTKGRDRMQFFLPETGTWRESTYVDAEDYANRGGHGRMYEVNITDLPDSIQALEGDCE